MPVAAKNTLSILVIPLYTEHFSENIWRWNAVHNLIHNSPANILQMFALFQSYFQNHSNNLSPDNYFKWDLQEWKG